MLDPYETLKISTDAPDEVIRAAYKVLASKYHPDKNPVDNSAACTMQRINDAYALLSDPARRHEYDSTRKNHGNLDGKPFPSTKQQAIIQCRNCKYALRVDVEVLNAPDRFKITCPACQKNPLDQPDRTKAHARTDSAHVAENYSAYSSRLQPAQAGNTSKFRPFVTALFLMLLVSVGFYFSKNTDPAEKPNTQHRPIAATQNDLDSPKFGSPNSSGRSFAEKPATSERVLVAERSMNEAEVEINNIWRALPKTIRDRLLFEQRAFNEMKEIKCARASSNDIDAESRKIARLKCWEAEYRKRIPQMQASAAALMAASGGQSTNDVSSDAVLARRRKDQLEGEINRVWRNLPKEIRDAHLDAQRRFNLDKEELCKVRASVDVDKERSIAECWAEHYARRVPELLALEAGLNVPMPSAIECPSQVSLNIESSNYSGVINIELRKGLRPGSAVVRRDSINIRGSIIKRGICPGTYFFAFSTPDSDQVSVTRYFDVTFNDTTYNNPTITVTYSRSVSNANRVGSAKRSDL